MTFPRLSSTHSSELHAVLGLHKYLRFDDIIRIVMMLHYRKSDCSYAMYVFNHHPWRQHKNLQSEVNFSQTPSLYQPDIIIHLTSTMTHLITGTKFDPNSDIPDLSGKVQPSPRLRPQLGQ